MATLKTCFKCGVTKPLFDFYRGRDMKDGHLNKCKECAKRDVSAHRAANIERLREYDRKRAKEPHRKEHLIAMMRKDRALRPERSRARSAVNFAVRTGKLVPWPCLVCGAKSEAHHPDYSRPLDVVWLCSVHHKEAHAIVGRFRNG